MFQIQKLRVVIAASAIVFALQRSQDGYSDDTTAQPRARDHHRLLYYIDRHDAEHDVANAKDWDERRRDILIGIQAAMGALPDRSALGPAQFERVPGSRADAGGCSREKIRIEVGDGDFVPAWLLIPDKLTLRAPGILALHQTNGALGKDEVIGLGGSANYAYGLELARRGYVVLAPDYPSLGEYAYDFAKDRFDSGSMKGIWNHLRCVDVLCSLDSVDPNRIGVIGHSLGGHNAIFVAAFDPRIKAVVTSCGWTPFHEYYRGDLTGWSGERYMPRVRSQFGLNPDRMPWDFYEAIAAIAPRAFFTSSPIRDANFDVGGVRKAMPVIGEVFELLGASDKPQAIYPDCEHDFPQSARDEAYRFLDRILSPRAAR